MLDAEPGGLDVVVLKYGVTTLCVGLISSVGMGGFYTKAPALSANLQEDGEQAIASVLQKWG